MQINIKIYLKININLVTINRLLFPSLILGIYLLKIIKIY